MSYRAQRAQPTLMQQVGARLRGALSVSRPRASQHVRTLTTSEQLAESMRAGSVSDAGVYVNPDSAMNVASVFACVRIISNAIAMCPLLLYRRELSGRETEAKDHPVYYLLRHRPNRFQTPFEFKQLVAHHLLLRGNSYWFVGKQGGWVYELFPMHPDQTQLYRWSELEWQYQFTPYNGGFQVFRPSEVMHARGLSTDGIEGISVLDSARQTIGLSIATERYGSKVFSNGTNLSGVITMGPGQKLGQEMIERLRTEWEQKYKGLDNAHKVPILEEGMEFKPMSMNNVDSQFIDSRKFSRSDIAMFFGVPPHMLGDVDKQTSWGSGIEQQSIGFVINTVQPWLTNIEDAINGALLSPDEQIEYFVRFDTEPLIRGAFRDQVEGIRTLREWGIISANEARQMLKMNPREDPFGDDYTVPSNMTSQIVGPEAGEQDRGDVYPMDPSKRLAPPRQ